MKALISLLKSNSPASVNAQNMPEVIVIISLEEICGKRVEETGHHVHTKSILGGAGKPPHVGPVSPSDEETRSVYLVPSLILHYVPTCIPPDHTFLASTL